MVLGGMAELYHQTVLRDQAQPVLVGAALSMMGLTAALRFDERRRKRDE